MLTASPIAAILLFYGEEDWRGKWAWEQCKAELEHRGQKLDWKAFAPAQVPADQNFFAVPKVKEWFTQTVSNDLVHRLTFGRDDFLRRKDKNPVLELTFVSPHASIDSGDADLVLQYEDSILRVAKDFKEPEGTNKAPIIPLIVMDEVPLSDAIRNLAHQEHLNYTFDAETGLNRRHSRPTVSIRLTDITAHDALLKILNNYNLALVPELNSNLAHIVLKGRSDGEFLAVSDVTDRLVELMRNATASRQDLVHGPSASSAQGFTTFVRSAPQGNPAHVFVRADKVPPAKEVEQFFPARILLEAQTSRGAGVELAGTNSFHVWLNPSPYTAAADYLAWSDSFVPDFEKIRDALRRPYARLDGDYRRPYFIPTPSFVAVRLVAQTLAQRAQCHLLLNQPEEALREVMLMRDLCLMLEGQPMTWVKAMIDVAVTGLYVDVIADGLRLDAWREPQLEALQSQLGKIDLFPIVSSAFAAERAAECHVLDRVSPVRHNYRLYNDAPGRKRNAVVLSSVLLEFAPRGWVYQNMATVATREQPAIDALESSRRLLDPKLVDTLSLKRPFDISQFTANVLLANVLPGYIKSIQTTARIQTLANEALVACALERYRLVHSGYPERLQALAPEFLASVPADLIGGQPLKYRSTPDGAFVLYSIGWNEKDDGGLPGTGSAFPATFDPDKGDWVWPFRQSLMN